MKTKAKVTRITIARLYNVGNYEHVRYELTAEVPRGVSAKKVAQGMLGVLKASSPRCPVDKFHLDQLQSRINLSAENQKTCYGENWQQKLELEKEELARLQKEMVEWESKRRLALEAMDDLTGAAKDDLPF